MNLVYCWQLLEILQINLEDIKSFNLASKLLEFFCDFVDEICAVNHRSMHQSSKMCVFEKSQTM